MIRFLLDVANLAFWTVILHSYRWVLYLVCFFVPTMVFERLGIALLEKHRIKVTRDKKVAGNYDKTKYDCELIVHNPSYFKRSFIDGSRGMGEAYMDGWWDCDDIAELSSCIVSMGESLYDRLSDRWHLASKTTILRVSVQVEEEHYSLGNNLYIKMLDPTMNYTCAYYKEDTKTLEEAQINKMDLVARKLKLKPGMKVLDLGCGFGATAKYLASKYGVSVVGYNISTAQVAYARKSCEGLDVTIHCEDYRKAAGKFDRIYSIGFLEHVGPANYREYFQLVNRCLKDDGITLVHTIVGADQWKVRAMDWTVRYIFPGGAHPFASELMTCTKDLFVVEDVHSLAKSYAKTLIAWEKNFQDHWKELEPQFGGLVGGRFFRMWNLYIGGAAGLFEGRQLQLLQVTYTKIGRKEEYYSVR